jgi:hypothetical protein
MIRKLVGIGAMAVSLALALPAQTSSSHDQSTPSQGTQPADRANDPSGMYSFLKEGEFVQVTVENGKLSGFISRFGESDSDRGTFIDQFFDKASLENDQISFTTKTVHGVWYELHGTIAAVPGKQPGQEGYRLIKGILVQHASDAQGQDKVQQRNVEFKSFPQDMGQP